MKQAVSLYIAGRLVPFFGGFNILHLFNFLITFLVISPFFVIIQIGPAIFFTEPKLRAICSFAALIFLAGEICVISIKIPIFQEFFPMRFALNSDLYSKDADY